ncbi:hypothetical protein Poli38472_011934 [Pythium oligandrum]|uniref:Uncharacterized protein n=1 Tax=Pythium oligandrum TaxID=41045 RepID=A0A8K1CR41_PYTOL|nr:hypothetical protein Poli38472_011934 [Pythium oligandrum]|eukprot:TMW66818.1 hypothetical protein Poli38472_011934 [Pythium oligandrum]
MVVEAIPTGLRLRWDISSSGGVPAMQLLLFNFEDITLPLLEGSVGRYVRLETVDGSDAIIDQGAIDTSSLFLSKAQVIINKTQLYLRESAVQSGDQYSISLTAPPQSPLGVSVAITAVQSTPLRHALTIEPSVAIFSQSNWSSSVTIQVLTQNDNIAGLHDDRVVVTHTIVESSEVSFAPIENVVVYIEDDDIPLVHLSRRHVAVVEALENDSYDIVLLSEPTDDVEIVVESVLPLVQVTPSTIVFTSNNWHVPQALLLTAQHPSPDVISSVRTQINHRVLSTDSNFNGIMARLVPQSSVYVHYEPQEMQSCIDPCRTGWFPLTNATTGASACVACPLGYYCSAVVPTVLRVISFVIRVQRARFVWIRRLRQFRAEADHSRLEMPRRARHVLLVRFVPAWIKSLLPVPPDRMQTLPYARFASLATFVLLHRFSPRNALKGPLVLPVLLCAHLARMVTHAHSPIHLFHVSLVKCTTLTTLHVYHVPEVTSAHH